QMSARASEGPSLSVTHAYPRDLSFPYAFTARFNERRRTKPHFLIAVVRERCDPIDCGALAVINGAIVAYPIHVTASAQNRSTHACPAGIAHRAEHSERSAQINTPWSDPVHTRSCNRAAAISADWSRPIHRGTRHDPQYAGWCHCVGRA